MSDEKRYTEGCYGCNPPKDACECCAWLCSNCLAEIKKEEQQ